MHWWILAYVVIGVGVDVALAEEDDKKWHIRTGVSLLRTRLIVMVIWPLLLLVGVILMLLED